MKVIITLEDEPNGNVATHIEFDPPVDDDSQHTNATRAMSIMMAALEKHIAP